MNHLEHFVRKAIRDVKRTAPVDLINFAPESYARFVGSDGVITIHHDNLNWRRIE